MKTALKISKQEVRAMLSSASSGSVMTTLVPAEYDQGVKKAYFKSLADELEKASRSKDIVIATISVPKSKKEIAQ